MDGQEPIMIFGRVTRGDGGPLSGAALTLCDLAGDQLDRATTDQGGHYQLVPPTGGTYLVICSSPTHHPQATLIAVADRPLRHDLALVGGGATLTGRVGARRRAAANGDGMRGSASGEHADRVVLTLTDVRGAVVAVTRSEHDGSYRFTDIGEGLHTLTAAAPDVGPVAETVQIPAEGDIVHDITLITQLQLTGVVRSAGGGRPVAEALATLVAEDGNVVGSAVTGDDGSFTFPDVDEGLYTITASGYAPVASEIEVGAGHPEEVVLTLVPPTVDGSSGPRGTPPTADRHTADRATAERSGTSIGAAPGDGAISGRHGYADEAP